MSNRNQDALKAFVDRAFKVESEFRDVKAERDEFMKDLKAEIKAQYDETGIEAREVMRLMAIRFAEQESREKRDELTGDIETLEFLYGKSSTAPAAGDDAEEDFDPLA